jgi:hypothetical protein
VERISGLEGDESASYADPDDATADILSWIQMCFRLVSKRWILRHVQYFGVDCWIWHKDCTLAPAFEDVIGKEKRWKKLDRILCIFVLFFFVCNLRMYGANFNIIPFPWEKNKITLHH